MKTRQEANVKRAYSRNDVDYDALSKIVRQSARNKTNMVNACLSGSDTHVFNMALNHEQIVSAGHWQMYEFFSMQNHLTFNLQSGTVTQRANGKCMPLKRFFSTIGNMINPDVKNIVLESIGKTVEMVISCDPFFLLGSSVSSNGCQLESSCHYPTDNGDYCSGAVSYALDSCTLIFGYWREDGLQGRQLVYVDPANGFITGRCYGEFTEAMSTACRQELYRLMKRPPFKKAKSDNAYHIDRDGYSGYLDDGYFTAFRHTSEAVSVQLAEAICISCGDYHSDGGILCDHCKNGCTCEACGTRMSEDDAYNSNGGYTYCEDCYNDRFARCHTCGDELSRNHGEIAEINGYDHCEDCARKKGYTKCESCGEYSDEVTECNGEPMCEDCLPAGRVCESCGEYKEDDDYSNEENNICTDCEAI